MKYIIVLILLLYSHSAFAQLIFDTTYIRRNVHFSESKVHTKINFRNKSTNTVTIKNINSPCGCIVGKLPKYQYNANESGSIEIIFDIDNRTGIQNKTVLIETESQQYTINLEYIIESPLTISSTNLTWTQDKNFQPKEIYIKANSQNIKTIKIPESFSNFKTVLENPIPNEFRVQIVPTQSKIGQYNLTIEAEYKDETDIKTFHVPIKLNVIPIRNYITIDEFKKRNNSIIIDARQSLFFDKQHIPNAINIPAKDANTKKDIFRKLLNNNKDKKSIVIYCASDSCPDATKLYDLLYSYGVQNLLILQGGIDAWITQNDIRFDLEK